MPGGLFQGNPAYGQFRGQTYHFDRPRYVSHAARLQQEEWRQQKAREWEANQKTERINRQLRTQFEKGREVSGVLWCEKDGWQNGHAFSSKDDQAELVTRRIKTGKFDDYGTEITRNEEFNVCGPHANGLFQPSDNDAKAVEATVVSEDSSLD